MSSTVATGSADAASSEVFSPRSELGESLSPASVGPVPVARWSLPKSTEFLPSGGGDDDVEDKVDKTVSKATE